MPKFSIFITVLWLQEAHSRNLHFLHHPLRRRPVCDRRVGPDRVDRGQSEGENHELEPNRACKFIKIRHYYYLLICSSLSFILSF
jgi:hypothetical protein